MKFAFKNWNHKSWIWAIKSWIQRPSQQRSSCIFFVDQTCQIKQVMILVVSFWNHQDGTLTCIDFSKLKGIGLKTRCHVEPKCSWLKHLQGCKMQINWLWNDFGIKPTIIPQKFSVQMKSPICRVVTQRSKLCYLSSVRDVSKALAQDALFAFPKCDIK